MSIRNIHVHNHLSSALMSVSAMPTNSIGAGYGTYSASSSTTNTAWPWVLPNAPVSDATGVLQIRMGDRYNGYRNNTINQISDTYSSGVFSIASVVHTMPAMANTPHIAIVVEDTTYLLSLFRIARGKIVLVVAISSRLSTSTAADPILGFDRVWGGIKEYPAYMRRELKLDHTPALFAYFVTLPLISEHHAMYTHIREFTIHAQPYHYVSILGGLFVGGTATYFKANGLPLSYEVNPMRNQSIIEFSTELAPLSPTEASPFRRTFPASVSTDSLTLTDVTGATASVPILDIAAALATGQTTVKYGGKTYLI